jgi:hypothetical protein
VCASSHSGWRYRSVRKDVLSKLPTFDSASLLRLSVSCLRQVLPFSISAFWVSGAPLFDQRLQPVDTSGGRCRGFSNRRPRVVLTPRPVEMPTSDVNSPVFGSGIRAPPDRQYYVAVVGQLKIRIARRSLRRTGDRRASFQSTRQERQLAKRPGSSADPCGHHGGWRRSDGTGPTPGPAWRTASMPTLISCPFWSLRDRRGRKPSREHPETSDRHPIAAGLAERPGQRNAVEPCQAQLGRRAYFPELEFVIACTLMSR